MKFWNASAIVPLQVAEPSTERVKDLLTRDADMLVWWGTEVECVSARTRLQRTAVLDGKGLALAFDRLRAFAGAWNDIEPSEIVRETAKRFCAFTRSEPEMHFNLPRHSSPPTAAHHPSKSSRSMSAWPRQPETKGSR